MSVCLSVRQTRELNCDKMKQTSAHILHTVERSMHLVFGHEEWLVGDVPFYLKFWGSDPTPSTTATPNRYFYSLVAPQPLDLVKKVQL